MNRLLWWASAVASYVVIVGIASMVVKSSRRRPYFEPDLNRNDQLAGLLLGSAKGMIVAACFATAIEKYTLGYLKGVPWIEEHARGSLALEWNRTYQPVPRLWTSAPVQHYVSQIQRMGLQGAFTNTNNASSPEHPSTPKSPSSTASESTKVGSSPDLPAEIARAVEAIEGDLKGLSPRN